jgi:KDO2-lipid IV(A) lauroyltransferase
MLPSLGYFLGAALCRMLPLPALYRLAHGIAGLCHAFQPANRRAVRSNLRVVLGETASEPEIRRRTLRVFCNFAERLVDFLRLSTVAPEELERAFVIEGEEHLERARKLAGGKILFLTAHMGNWEWGAARLGLSGELHGVVAMRHEADAVERMFRSRRGSFGLHVMDERQSAPGVVSMLRAGSPVGMLVDRDVTRDGMNASFFGRRARVPRAHVSLALRAGAVILPGFVVCEPGGRHRLIFEPALDPRELGGVRAGVNACLAVLEKYIRRYPEQWLVFEPMWPEVA